MRGPIRPQALLAVAAVVLAVARAAWPWGCDGHRVVALVAWAELDPHTRDAAGALLRAHPIPADRRGCTPPSRNPLADASTWADAVREDERGTAPWHYVNVPLDATRAELPRLCPFARCVSKALTHQVAVLESDAAGAERARALRFVVHLVADLHQPLHATTNGDRGGNCLPVTYLGERPRADRRGERWEPNLHGVWDARLIATLLGRAHASPERYAADLRRRFAREITAWRRAEPRVDDWVWETHRVGVEVAYGRLSKRVPAEPRGRLGSCRDGRDVGARMARLGLRADDAYVDAVRTALEEQLARSGARLAALLSRALAPRSHADR